MPYQFKNFDFNSTLVTAMLSDSTTPGYLWVGFEKNGNNICKLQKLGGHDLDQVYYDLDLLVDKINNMKILNSQIFLAVDDDTYMGYRTNKDTPFSNPNYIDRPAGITEQAIDLASISFYMYYLTPGIASGEVAKIVQVNQSGVHQETLVMNESGKVINNAVSMVSDGTNLWIVTGNNPTELVRVYESGGTLQYEVTVLTV